MCTIMAKNSRFLTTIKKQVELYSRIMLKSQFSVIYLIKDLSETSNTSRFCASSHFYQMVQ